MAWFLLRILRLCSQLSFARRLEFMVEESAEGCHKSNKGLSSFLGAISEAFVSVVEESDTPHVKTVKDTQMRISEPYDGVKVPNEVTHDDFWCLYFYRIHQFYQEEARTTLKERAEKIAHSEDLKWEDEESTLNSDIWDEDLDMTEEEIQATLSRTEDLRELEVEEWNGWICEQE